MWSLSSHRLNLGREKILVVLYVASLSDVYEKTCTLLSVDSSTYFMSS